MAIKSTVSDTPCKKKELPFPKLMVRESNPFTIVLFNSKFTGTIVAGKGKVRGGVGFYGRNFSDSAFKDYKGSVCLENSDTI